MAEWLNAAVSKIAMVATSSRVQIPLSPFFFGNRLKKNSQSKAPKKIPETNAIFENLKNKESKNALGVKRLSMDCKATVNVGDYSRGGKLMRF